MIGLYLCDVTEIQERMKYITHTPTHKDVKVWIALLLLVGVLPALTGYALDKENPFFLIPLFVIVGFFIFNLAMRKSPSMAGYFMSPYNLFTSKVREELSFDFSKELAFEKVKEVLEESPFELVVADDGHLTLQASAKMTWKSWGENIYIWFEGSGDQTTMKFCSVTLFQVFAWGKNEQNVRTVLDAIEDSLTV